MIEVKTAIFAIAAEAFVMCCCLLDPVGNIMEEFGIVS